MHKYRIRVQIFQKKTQCKITLNTLRSIRFERLSTQTTTVRKLYLNVLCLYILFLFRIVNLGIQEHNATTVCEN